MKSLLSFLVLTQTQIIIGDSKNSPVPEHCLKYIPSIAFMNMPGKDKEDSIDGESSPDHTILEGAHIYRSLSLPLSLGG